MAVETDTREITADAQLRAGDVDGATATLRARLRLRPDDRRARMFLFQLLCVAGDWDRARAQLSLLAQLAPETRMLATAYGQAIAGEVARAAAMRGEDPAPLLRASPGWALDLANAFAADARGAAEMRARAFAAAPDLPGTIDGRAFSYLYDGDGRFGPTFEAIVAGRWGLLPFCVVEEIRTEGPVDLRDLVWLPAEIRLRDGGAVAALLPARYPGSERAEDDRLRLARRTDWSGEGDPHGIGQRVWTTDRGEEIGLLGFRHLRFAPLS